MTIDEITITTCPTCCLQYPLEKRVVELKRKLQETIYCPNGHAGIFTKKETISTRPIEEVEQENLKLIHKVEMLEAKIESLEHANLSLFCIISNDIR